MAGRSRTPAVQRTTLLSPPPERASGTPDLLVHLQPGTRAAVLAIGRRRDYREGDYLFRQGDPHDGVSLVDSGVVKSFYVSEDGRELTLGFWTGGHYEESGPLRGWAECLILRSLWLNSRGGCANGCRPLNRSNRPGASHGWATTSGSTRACGCCIGAAWPWG